MTPVRPNTYVVKDRRENVLLAAKLHLKSAIISAASCAAIGTTKLNIQYLDYLVGEPITDVVGRAIDAKRGRDRRPIKIIVFLDKPG